MKVKHLLVMICVFCCGTFAYAALQFNSDSPPPLWEKIITTSADGNPNSAVFVEYVPNAAEILDDILARRQREGTDANAPDPDPKTLISAIHIMRDHGTYYEETYSYSAEDLSKDFQALKRHDTFNNIVIVAAKLGKVTQSAHLPVTLRFLVKYNFLSSSKYYDHDIAVNLEKNKDTGQMHGVSTIQMPHQCTEFEHIHMQPWKYGIKKLTFKKGDADILEIVLRK